jgi:hypothetical protein
MSTAGASAFFAYPSQNSEVTSTISETLAKLERTGHRPKIKPWIQNDISGRFLRSPIIEAIEDAACLFADVSILNFNVTYEIGYAIGRSKRVVLVRHGAIKQDWAAIQRIGIFDTLGVQPYVNSLELASIVEGVSDLRPLEYTADYDQSQPVYILETPHKTETMLQILGRVKKEKLFYRSYDASEQTRLAGPDAVQEVAASYGVVVPLLTPDYDQAEIHNIRAAFVAGLAHGMGRETLLLSTVENTLVPLDVRDLVESYRFPRDVRDIISKFQKRVLGAMQSGGEVADRTPSALASLTLGSSIAENEFQHLSEYFLQTDQYQRVLRGETDIVAGRKGAGKTALFAQARNNLRANRKNIVVDLKPEGFQLLKLKDQVLSYLGDGAKAHVLVAFWECILVLEVARKVLEKDAQVHLRDHNLYEPYNLLKAQFDGDYDSNEGDFSERLTSLSEKLGSKYIEKFGRERKETISSGEVTALIYSDELLRLMNPLLSYLRQKDDVWILIDNLDKSWSTTGVSKEDVLIIRCLIDASKKLQREFERKGQKLKAIIFIRDDVYRFLLSETPDHGKEDRLLLDWREPEQLKVMIHRRLIQNDQNERDFKSAWEAICVPKVGETPSFDFILSHCLMRPRYIINCINHCKAYAVNMGHDRIELPDIERGLKAYSDDLLVDTDLELSDVFPQGKNVLYEFAGVKSVLSKHEFYEAVSKVLPREALAEQLLQVLMWQGVVGVRKSEGDAIYIYDVGYNMARLSVHRRRADESGAESLCFHPAYWRGLEIYA